MKKAFSVLVAVVIILTILCGYLLIEDSRQTAINAILLDFEDATNERLKDLEDKVCSIESFVDAQIEVNENVLDVLDIIVSES